MWTKKNNEQQKKGSPKALLPVANQVCHGACMGGCRGKTSPAAAEKHNHFPVAVPLAWLCIPVNTTDSVLGWEAGENKAAGSDDLSVARHSLEKSKKSPEGNKYLPTCHKTRQTGNGLRDGNDRPCIFPCFLGEYMHSLIKQATGQAQESPIYSRLVPSSFPLICLGPLFFP